MDRQVYLFHDRDEWIITGRGGKAGAAEKNSMSNMPPARAMLLQTTDKQGAKLHLAVCWPIYIGSGLDHFPDIIVASSLSDIHD